MTGRVSLPGSDELEIPAFFDTGDAAALERWKQEHPDWFVAGHWTPGRPGPDADAMPPGPKAGQAVPAWERALNQPLDPTGFSLADFKAVAAQARQDLARRDLAADPGFIPVQARVPPRGPRRPTAPRPTLPEETREFRFYEALRTIRRLEPQNRLADVLRDPDRAPGEDVVRLYEREAADALARDRQRVAPSGPGEPDPATPFQRARLRDELIKEGFMSPDSRYEAHHLVPGGGPMSGNRDAGLAQETLRRFNMNLDSATNGVPLSPEFHRRLHTLTYYKYVNLKLGRTASPREAISFLRGLARRLQAADIQFQRDGKMPAWED